jgi:CRP-like cAMP-binding protein
VRFLRRVHGFLPHRRADQQDAWWQDRLCPATRFPSKISRNCFSRKFPARSWNSTSTPWSNAASRPGEIICREGEYGSTAFYIVEGKARSLPVDAHGPREDRRRRHRIPEASWEAASPGRSRTCAEGENAAARFRSTLRWILPYEQPVAELGPGDLFGEMTCMSLYPRSATVRATTDCVMYEMLRNVLDIMQRNKSIKGLLDENYKKRALEDHLKSVPCSRAAAGLHRLAPQIVELLRYGKGDVICRQGEVADSFYLIRIGFVKVTENHPGGDLVLAYLGRGGYFGEIGLLTDADAARRPVPRSITWKWCASRRTTSIA